MCRTNELLHVHSLWDSENKPVKIPNKVDNAYRATQHSLGIYLASALQLCRALQPLEVRNEGCTELHCGGTRLLPQDAHCGESLIREAREHQSVVISIASGLAGGTGPALDGQELDVAVQQRHTIRLLGRGCRKHRLYKEGRSCCVLGFRKVATLLPQTLLFCRLKVTAKRMSQDVASKSLSSAHTCLNVLLPGFQKYLRSRGASSRKRVTNPWLSSDDQSFADRVRRIRTCKV